MSKFFRSADSTSSSATDSDGEDDTHRNSESAFGSSNAETTALQSSNGQQSTNRSPATWTNRHRDVLLHALLEERCLNEALAAFENQSPPRTRESPDVKAEAKARYERLCGHLAAYDLVPAGLDTDQHAVTRQRYRDGLDLLSQQNPNAAAPNAPSLTRMLTDRAHEDEDVVAQQYPSSVNSTPAATFLNNFLMPDENTWSYRHPQGLLLGEAPIIGGSGGSLALQAMNSRYYREYEQISTLGHGGYGIVYQARHRLDNQVYAIKKVPLSMARLQRIQANGPSELDELLRELRTLARLNHPNVVRYYTGWIEWDDGSSAEMLPSDGNTGGIDRNNAEGGNLDSRSFGRIVTQSDVDGDDVVFEDSRALPSPTDVDNEASSQCSSNIKDSSPLSPSTVRRPSKASTSGNSTIESISRSLSTTNIHTSTSGPRFAGPTLALHMQMSLHPMTLADFLAPLSPPSPTTDTISSPPPPLTHCFHLVPSLQILLATLSGLAYLHAENIVHRDVKPANIFLSARSAATISAASPTDYRSTNSVDLSACPHCRASNGTPNPVVLDVCIGDFGLVALADPESDAAASGDGSTESRYGAGTEIYRPLGGEENGGLKGPNTDLDVFAMGIVASELLQRFETRMERLQAIQRVKRGVWPERFCERVGRECTGWLEAMLGLGPEGRCCELESAREGLRAVLDAALRER